MFEAAEPVAAEPVAAEPVRGKIIPDDPLAVVGINNDNRRKSAHASVLWTADEVKASWEAQSDPLKHTAPTIFPPKNGAGESPLDQQDYTAVFGSGDPLAAAVLLRVNKKTPGGPRVWVAGGRAAAPHFGAGQAGDTDFFVTLDNPGERWGVVESIVKAIHGVIRADIGRWELFPGYVASMASETLMYGLMSITLSLKKPWVPGSSQFRWTHTVARVVKYQIILRAYPSVAALLHAFDIGSSCIAFDGHTTVMTTMGAYAQRYGVNIVVPSYRSPSFEKRMCKYFDRGYALCFPDLDIGSLKPGKDCVLPYMTLRPHRVRGDRVTGTVECRGGAPPSDYDPSGELADSFIIDRFSAGKRQLHDCASEYSYLATLAGGGSRYRVTCTTHEKFLHGSEYGCEPEPDECQGGGALSDYARGYEGLPLASWYGPRGTPLTLGSMLSAERMSLVLEKAVNNALHGYPTQRTNPKSMMKLLGMTEGDVARVNDAFTSAIRKHPGRMFCITSALERFCVALTERYIERKDDELDWWIVEDPGSQWTASMTPVAVSPEDWYGDKFEPYAERPPHAIIESLMGEVSARADLPDICALCISPITGQKNLVVLGCGHRFHFSKGGSTVCEGLSAWLVDHRSCPTCRRDVGKEDGWTFVRPPRVAPVPIVIDWGAAAERP